MSQNGETTSVAEETVAPSNELDIDDGTMPIEEAAQAEETEETPADQVAGDDDGDTDASQTNETEQDAETPEKVETPAQTPEPKAEAPAAPAWKAHYEKLVEEFGETAAAPFKAMIEPMAAQLAEQARIIDAMKTAATRNVRQSEIAYVENLCAEAGIKGKGETVYRDAEKLLKLGSDDGKPLTPMEAVKEAIRLRGGREKSAQAPAKTTSTAAEKAARLERLRSVPPKARANAPIDFENDDPATIDGTAPKTAR